MSFTLRQLSIAALLGAAALPLSQAVPLEISSDLQSRASSSSSDAFTSCLASAQTASSSDGDSMLLSYPDHKSYPRLSSSYNPVFDYKPSVVIVPDNAQDVASVVKCVAAQGGKQKFAPKSGGHSYEAYSLGGADGAVVLDLKNLNFVNIDSNAKTAKVGPGVRLGLLASKLADAGFALPHGTCPYVGVSGHGMGGGFGYASRAWGYLLDNIISVEVVTADGKIVTASSSHNSDLFYAIKGAGSNNFGVVTSFTYSLHDAPAKVQNFNYYFKSNDDCAHALVALQTVAASSDPSIGFPAELTPEMLFIGSKGGEDYACSLSGQHLNASKEQHEAAMASFNAKINKRGVYPMSSSTVQQFDWIGSLENIMGDLDTSGPQPHESFYAKSLVQPGTGARYDFESAKALIDLLDSNAGIEGTGNSITFEALGPLSKPNQIAEDATSFVHRDALFMDQFYSYGFPTSNADGAQDRVHAFFDKLVSQAQSIAPDAKWGAYQNYIDRRLSGWAEMYYGSARERLSSIKKKWDAGNIFDFAQGVAHF